MSVSDLNKTASDDAQVVQVESASGNVLAVSAAGEASVQITQPLPAGTNTLGSLNNISGTVSLPTGAATASNQTSGSQKTQVVDASGNVISSYANCLNVFPKFSPGTQEIFGSLITAHRNNQIWIDFAKETGDAVLGSYLNVSTTGSGSTALNTNGTASFSTGTSGTGYATAVSPNSLLYDPGFEIYVEFTATFTTPTSANTYQRIGLYNSTQGFWIGYSGTSFVVATRNSGVDTTIAKASWNVDTLTGAANSLFTRNGTPEAINFNNLNIFRIRFGWLGAGPILFEVMSPDGQWITFHRISYPNSSANPSIASPTLPITVEVNASAADTTNYTITSACWAAGTTDGHESDTLVQPTILGALNAYAVISLAGQQGVGFQIFAGTLIGTLTPQLSFDNGASWINTLFYNPATQSTLATLQFTSANTLTTLSLVPTGGASHARVIITSYTSGTANAFMRATSAIATTITTSSGAVSSGTVFSVASLALNMATTGTENPLILLKNSSSNTKSMYIQSAYCGINTANRAAAFDIYSSPTVSANGTAMTIVNRNIGSAVASVMNAYTAPTVTSNGTLFSTFVIGQNSNSNSILDAFNLKIPPGGSILFTGNPNSNGTGAYISITWSEY